MDPATRICAHLIRDQVLRRKDFPDLDAPSVRQDVEAKLGAVGLQIVQSPHDWEHISIRLDPELARAEEFDTADNLGLKRDARALLAVLWMKLVFPTRQTGAAPPPTTKPRVNLRAIAQEHPGLGSFRHLQILAGQLRNLGFVQTLEEDEIAAKPLLELAIHADPMLAFAREHLASGDVDLSKIQYGEDELAILEALRRARQPQRPAQVAEATDATTNEAERRLNALVKTGRVGVRGRRRDRAYFLKED